jgi:hypothetical protein
MFFLVLIPKKLANHRSSRANGVPVGPNRPGVGANHPPVGPNHVSVGPNRAAVGANHPLVGPNHAAVGPNRPAVGANRLMVGAVNRVGQTIFTQNRAKMTPQAPEHASNRLFSPTSG